MLLYTMSSIDGEGSQRSSLRGPRKMTDSNKLFSLQLVQKLPDALEHRLGGFSKFMSHPLAQLCNGARPVAAFPDKTPKRVQLDAKGLAREHRQDPAHHEGIAELRDQEHHAAVLAGLPRRDALGSEFKEIERFGLVKAHRSLAFRTGGQNRGGAPENVQGPRAWCNVVQSAWAYPIALGGAASSGRPAFRSGIKVRMRPTITNTKMLTMNDGSSNTFGVGSS